MSRSPSSPSTTETVLRDSPNERVVLRRSEGRFTIVAERTDTAGQPVRQELELGRAAMTQLIEMALNDRASSEEPPLDPRLEDAVIHRTLRDRAEDGDANAVRRLHLLLGEQDLRQTQFLAAQRALHRLAYMPLASREPWGCWSDTLRGHGAKAFAAIRLVAMAGYVLSLTAVQLKDYRELLAEEHSRHTGAEPDDAAIRADIMLQVVNVLAPDQQRWRAYSLRLDLAKRLRETPPKRPRELALLTLRTLGFEGPKAHDFLKGARGSTRGWKWRLFDATPPPSVDDLATPKTKSKRDSRRAVTENSRR
jgi:hypothetical protein